MIKDEKRTYYVTTNYEQFKRLRGNRDVKAIQKNKLIKSISEIGFVTNPIIVNENMEVIDGQGRLSALEELKMPVPYIVVPGVGERECKRLNINQTNWKFLDYVKGYAETGDKSYAYLLVLIDKYRWIPAQAVAAASKGLSSDSSASVKQGTYYLSDGEFYEASQVLDFVTECEVALKQFPGDLSTKVLGLAWVIKNTTADKKRIKKVLAENAPTFRPVPRHEVAMFLADLTKCYNQNLKKDENKISFVGEYQIKNV